MEGSFRILSYLGKSDGLSSIFTPVTGGKRVILGNFPPIFAGGEKASGPFFGEANSTHLYSNGA